MMATKKTYIFDMDGTLYSQKKMRMSMLRKLLGYYFTHFTSFKELVGIYYFRKYRELNAYKSFSIQELSDVIAQKIGLSKDEFFDAIDRWMFQIPLDIIKMYAYVDVLKYIEQKKKENCRIYIYSDYPAEGKADAMGISYDEIFISEEIGNGELKPSLSAMNDILSRLGMDIQSVLYVGDRYEKDGKSAELVGMDYMDITEFRKNL